MALFNKVLFPTDLSEASKKLIPYVRNIIINFDAELHVVYPMNIDPAYIRPKKLPPLSDSSSPMTKMEAEENTRAFIESQFKDFSVQFKILDGPPGKEILRYAKEEGADLIVMEHSSQEIAEAAFGSVAGYVAKHSHIPVLIINPGINRVIISRCDNQHPVDELTLEGVSRPTGKHTFAICSRLLYHYLNQSNTREDSFRLRGLQNRA